MSDDRFRLQDDRGGDERGRVVPNVKTMGLIARQALLLLEPLLSHGPRSIAAEFQKDRDAITRMATFQHIDEKGYPSSQISLTFIAAVAVTLT